MTNCSLCYGSLLAKKEVQLTYQQQLRLRFFNASHRGQVHDIVTINGDNCLCRHKFHLYCIVHFHSNYYSEEVLNECGDKEVFPCPATHCPAYFTGPNGFHVTPYNEYVRMYSPEDPRIPIFDRPDAVDLTNDFINGRTNIWEWTEPAKLEPLAGFSTQREATEAHSSTGHSFVAPSTRSVSSCQSSMARNDFHSTAPTAHCSYAPVAHSSTADVGHSSTATTAYSPVGPTADDDDDLIDLINSLGSVELDEALGFKAEDNQADAYYGDDSMDVDPVADYVERLNLSPVSPSPTIASRPPSPTLSEASTVPLDPNFRIVGQMLRHMEDRHLHEIGWTPSTTIHQARSRIYVQFLHAFPLNPQFNNVDNVQEPNATPEEFLQDIDDHMTDVMWTNSDFEPYVSIYRVGVRHVLGIFAAIPRGLPMQCQPIAWPQKEYIFSITNIIPYLRCGSS